MSKILINWMSKVLINQNSYKIILLICLYTVCLFSVQIIRTLQIFAQMEPDAQEPSNIAKQPQIRIIAAYQTSGTIKSSQWTKRGNRSWVGELYKFNVNKQFATDESQVFSITGYYPDIKKEIFVHLYGKPYRSVSMYVNVHGIANRPNDLIFVQPPTNAPKFTPLKNSHFSIQNTHPTWIHSGKKVRDYFGYWHPVIHLYFLGSEFEPKKQLETPTTKTPDTKPRSPLTSDWNIFVPQQCLIIIDVTDDDRRYISFKKSREAVLTYLNRIRWGQDQTISKYLKIASAFEGHLKHLSTIDDIQSELPKIMAPSSLKDQLHKAFESFDAINGPKHVIYIVSAKRADVITPYNLDNLRLNTVQLKSENKHFHSIVVGDYGGNSLKELTGMLEGQFYRCNGQKEIVKKLEAILHNRG
ncbi:hypothetical protein MHK_009925 [Candidatus Magnetomorum sp. HK-1]|nr:hypothetical protein MHK_009925 [Candidatus Magnetomorum sp. HK-1]